MPYCVNLSGKTAFVTGSTRGIGYGLALALAGAGADIVVTSRHQDECERVCGVIRGIGVKALPVAFDVRDRVSIEVAAARAVKYFGAIDILINNAGTAVTEKAEDLSEAQWDMVMDTNLKGVFFCAQVIGRHMIERKVGKIINIASIFGVVGQWNILPYCVAKGGVIQMTRALALEWSRYNILVNAICPGYVKTAMNSLVLEDERTYKNILQNIPERRLGLPEDLASAAIFLASDGSNYMTGQTMIIDGGWTAK